MPQCWIGAGSNQQRVPMLRSARAMLAEHFGQLRLSPVYESAAVGFIGAPFLNLVIGIDSSMPLGTVLTTLRAIEDRHGRQRGADKFAPRTLDLDLLTYGDWIGVHERLVLPREEITCHAFVLAPLAAVAPDERHPVLGQTYGALWARFPNPDSVQRYDFSWTTV